ncbi:ECs_2282 family putative zinc-binding protein [Klebsiella pneumoniae]|uniref:ECs_2282 family putative zinc-binding protein n=1 Tax=Klebsiella pneumoniae TaxID=573 RepID=UPI003D769DED
MISWIASTIFGVHYPLRNIRICQTVLRRRLPECGQALTFNDILHVETIDEIKNTLCPYCKMLISKEEITRQIQSNVARRIEAMLGGLK